MPLPRATILDLVWVLLQVDLVVDTGEDPEEELGFLWRQLPPGALGPGERTRDGLVTLARAFAGRVHLAPATKGAKRLGDSRSREETRFRLYPPEIPQPAPIPHLGVGVKPLPPVRTESEEEIGDLRAVPRRAAEDVWLCLDELARLADAPLDELGAWTRARELVGEGEPPRHRLGDLLGFFREGSPTPGKAVEGGLLTGPRPELAELVARELRRSEPDEED
jgi:hypothetical protein